MNPYLKIILRNIHDPLRQFKKLRWWLATRGGRRPVTLDTENGRLTFYSDDKIVGQLLFIQRSFEMDFIRAAIGRLRDDGYATGNGAALDVGANIGMIGIALVKHGFFDRVAAFEPEPDNFELLKRNVAQNQMEDRIECLPIALSSEDGAMAMELSPKNFGDHRIRMENPAGALAEDKRRVIAISTRRLDSWAAGRSEYEGDNLKLIWLDIQGHEGYFLRGAQKTIRRSRSPVVCEFWPYGIDRTSAGKGGYLETVRDLFTHYYIHQRQGFILYPIDRLNDLYDQFNKRYSDVAQLIYVNRNWLADGRAPADTKN